ncbi:hypothetical protein CAEBREN_09904 [Caenorhabditis brenneri]|uniref:Uncharacterized protein n=1 Tax=Caenorhabditis brenneri TaxID=135651 RepID=G0MB23_CAEBE|nr:hypothetical protein CAEBREN_09904 [Caenorhabditis brenneri]
MRPHPSVVIRENQCGYDILSNSDGCGEDFSHIHLSSFKKTNAGSTFCQVAMDVAKISATSICRHSKKPMRVRHFVE